MTELQKAALAKAEELKEILLQMPTLERIAFWDAFKEAMYIRAICKNCGGDGGWRCPCENDE